MLWMSQCWLVRSRNPKDWQCPMTITKNRLKSKFWFLITSNLSTTNVWKSAWWIDTSTENFICVWNLFYEFYNSKFRRESILTLWSCSLGKVFFSFDLCFLFSVLITSGGSKIPKRGGDNYFIHFGCQILSFYWVTDPPLNPPLVTFIIILLLYYQITNCKRGMFQFSQN
jgi:hypothetical protein